MLVGKGGKWKDDQMHDRIDAQPKNDARDDRMSNKPAEPSTYGIEGRGRSNGNGEVQQKAKERCK